MDAMVDFIFRNKLYRCEAFLDDSELPCYVFTVLQNEELIREFGSDITLKTDLETLLSRRDDLPAMLELRKAIFGALKNTALFAQVKQKWTGRKRFTSI